MASSPQKNLQFISPPKEAGDFLQNQVKIDGEDSQQDLILFLLKLINKIPDNLSNDKIIFSYIHHSLKNEYIHLQKKEISSSTNNIFKFSFGTS